MEIKKSMELEKIKEKIFDKVNNIEEWLNSLNDQLSLDKDQALEILDKNKIKLGELLIEIKYELSSRKSISIEKKDAINEEMNKLKQLLDHAIQEPKDDVRSHRIAIVSSIEKIKSMLDKELDAENRLLKVFVKRTDKLKNNFNTLKIHILDKIHKRYIFAELEMKKEKIRSNLVKYKQDIDDKKKLNEESIETFEKEVTRQLNEIRESVNKLFHDMYF